PADGLGIEPPGTQHHPGSLLRCRSSPGRPPPTGPHPIGFGSPAPRRLARQGGSDHSGTDRTNEPQRGSTLRPPPAFDRHRGRADGSAGTMAYVRGKRTGPSDPIARHVPRRVRGPVGRASPRNLVRPVSAVSPRLWTNRFRPWTKKRVTLSRSSGNR